MEEALGERHNFNYFTKPWLVERKGSVYGKYIEMAWL